MGRGRSRARMWSQLETRELRRRAAPAPHTPRAHSCHSCRLPGREHADSRRLPGREHADSRGGGGSHVPGGGGRGAAGWACPPVGVFFNPH